jgi:hypothetical protein
MYATDGEVANASLHQYQMRGLRSNRVLGCDALPVVQVGLEVYRPRQ